MRATLHIAYFMSCKGFMGTWEGNQNTSLILVNMGEIYIVGMQKCN